MLSDKYKALQLVSFTPDNQGIYRVAHNLLDKELVDYMRGAFELDLQGVHEERGDPTTAKDSLDSLEYYAKNYPDCLYVKINAYGVLTGIMFVLDSFSLHYGDCKIIFLSLNKQGSFRHYFKSVLKDVKERTACEYIGIPKYVGRHTYMNKFIKL